jgi:hypothetical protein
MLKPQKNNPALDILEIWERKRKNSQNVRTIQL